MLEDRDFPTIPGDVMPDNVAHELHVLINELVGSRGTHFVGSQPVSFQMSHLTETLQNRDYFVCEKTDGLRCLMFCTLDPMGDEAVFLITRDNLFYRVPDFHFPLPHDPNSCHNGTLIDGELVISKRPADGLKELRYFMFDCLALNQKNIVTRQLQSRLGYLETQFFRPYIELRTKHPKECEKFPFKLSMKNMTESYKIPKVLDNLGNLGHVSDGLIFTCCDTPYMFGTDQTLLKWKPSDENTVDFRLHMEFPLYVDDEVDERDPDRVYPDYDSKPGMELHVWHGDTRGVSAYSSFAPLKCTDAEWEKLKALEQPLEERIVECNKDMEGNWRLLRFRDDKANGNHVTIVKKVLKSIQDAVSQEQLKDACPSIAHRWKEREMRKRASHQNEHHQQQNQNQQHRHENHRQGDDDREKRKHEEEQPQYVDDSDEDEQDAKRAKVD